MLSMQLLRFEFAFLFKTQLIYCLLKFLINFIYSICPLCLLVFLGVVWFLHLLLEMP